jgi:hypothetical protein
MAKRQKIKEMRLIEIESEFHSLLLSCLRECARGRYGLFGQNAHLDPDGRYLGWPDAKRLRDLAYEIRAIRQKFGEANCICERFLQLCLLRGPNVPGEPKLASQFLVEMDQG